nr:MAG TPA_asm: hypothetical protein [Bacteriophage sp.]
MLWVINGKSVIFTSASILYLEMRIVFIIYSTLCKMEFLSFYFCRYIVISIKYSSFIERFRNSYSLVFIYLLNNRFFSLYRYSIS